MSDDGLTFEDTYLNNLRALFEETRNPVFAWQAIDACLNIINASALPSWCLAVLAETSRNIALISEGKDYRSSNNPPSVSDTSFFGDPVGKSYVDKIDWDRQIAMLPGALGLTTRGKNQFKNARSTAAKRRAAINEGFQRKLLNKGAAAAADVVKDQLGLADRDSARAAIREGKRILKRESRKT